jgi:hypothetical protein
VFLCGVQSVKTQSLSPASASANARPVRIMSLSVTGDEGSSVNKVGQPSYSPIQIGFVSAVRHLPSNPREKQERTFDS